MGYLIRPLIFMMLMLLVGFSWSAQAAGFHSSALPSKTKGIFVKGFKQVKEDCHMYSTPSENSRRLVALKKGQKIWLESFDVSWSMGFRRSGAHGFIANHCLI